MATDVLILDADHSFPSLYSTEHFSKARKRAKRCRENRRKRGGQQRGAKRKKDA